MVEEKAVVGYLNRGSDICLTGFKKIGVSNLRCHVNYTKNNSYFHC